MITPEQFLVVIHLCLAADAKTCIDDAVPVQMMSDCSNTPAIQAYLAKHYEGSGLEVKRITCQFGAKA